MYGTERRVIINSLWVVIEALGRNRSQILHTPRIRKQPWEPHAVSTEIEGKEILCGKSIKRQEMRLKVRSNNGAF
jgi:hypothetical protein